jgi:hypothetical protein
VPGLLTTKSFDSFFVARRADGKHVQYSNPDSLIAVHIANTFGSSNDFVNYVFNATMEADLMEANQCVAWFVYDRVQGKLRFFTKKFGW